MKDTFLLSLIGLTALGLFLPERWIKPFRSVRLNVGLFTVIAVLSASGTFLPQEQASRLVYHAWWFAALLALLAFNVVTCKLRRLPFLVFGPHKVRGTSDRESIEHFFSKSKMKGSVPSTKSSKQASDCVRSWLQKKGWRFEEHEKPVGTAFFAGRHRIQRWGDFVLHVSIVVVLAGSLMGAIFGFEEVLAIPEGETLQMKNRPYQVRLNDFNVQYYEGTGAPSVYESDITVLGNGAEVAQKKIVVNDPLDIQRVRFYQASWGMTYNFKSARVHIAGKAVELPQNKVVSIPGTPLAVRANLFMPSFGVDANDQATTTDFLGNNPALQIDFLDNGRTQARVWILKNSPDIAFREVDNRLTQAAPPPFHLIDVDPILFSGIQVGYDPGASLFWIGSIALLVGLSMHFYLHQRRFRILVTKQGTGSEITIGGWNSRAIEDFRVEFSDWVHGLQRALS